MERRIAGVILAAGQSRRFGARDKLLESVAGRPMAAHAAAAMSGLDLWARGVVCPPEKSHMFNGFSQIDAPVGAEQSASLKAAVRFAQAQDATALLIALGDMPFVTRADLAQVVTRGGDGGAAASDGTRRLPPAIFPASDFAALAQAEGDQGARGILRGLADTQLVRLPPAHLQDIDTPEDLARFCG